MDLIAAAVAKLGGLSLPAKATGLGIAVALGATGGVAASAADGVGTEPEVVDVTEAEPTAEPVADDADDTAVPDDADDVWWTSPSPSTLRPRTPLPRPTPPTRKPSAPGAWVARPGRTGAPDREVGAL